MPESLPTRFLDNLRALGVGGEPARLLVAVSGGRDSMTLLHLLRFHARELPLALTVAHLDHAMREESADDARWLRGVCAAWELPMVEARLSRPARGETEARSARYAFLRRAAREAKATFVVTAHHADDQAETVLFRVLRGTGLAGLAGIPGRSRSGLLRPLLPFWREEIDAYAAAARLGWREDATNRSPGAARNRIRLELLPLVEREVAPGARRNLVALAGLAAEAEAAIEREVARAMAEAVREEGEETVLARGKVREYDSAIASRIVRNSLRRFGVVPGRTGTRRALQFISQAPSGRELELPEGVRIRVEFDAARLARASAPAEDLPLVIDTLGGRLEGRVRVGGREYGVTAGVGSGPGEPGGEPGGWRVALPLAAVSFPLTLRGWAAGDRVRTPGGTKTLKKLFLERRVPRSTRHRLPVLADASGRVVWVGGLDRSPVRAPAPGEDALFLTVAND